MHVVIAIIRVALFTLLALSLGVPARAQSRLYVGGGIGLMTQAQETTIQQLGGTTWSGAVLVGVQLSPRVGVEFESSFGGECRGREYTYRPSASLVAHVVSKGRDTFFTFQVRRKVHALEPVAGVSYVRSNSSRHGAFVPEGRTYFDDEQRGNSIAFVAGLDASIRIASHFSLVPTFRAFAILRPTPSLSSTRVGGAPFVLRYGAGARVTF